MPMAPPLPFVLKSTSSAWEQQIAASFTKATQGSASDLAAIKTNALASDAVWLKSHPAPAGYTGDPVKAFDYARKDYIACYNALLNAGFYATATSVATAPPLAASGMAKLQATIAGLSTPVKVIAVVVVVVGLWWLFGRPKRGR